MKLWIGLALIASGLIFFTTTAIHHRPVADGTKAGALAAPISGNACLNARHC